MNIDLKTISLLDSSICKEFAEDHIILSTINNIGMNIVVLSNETLLALHIGVADQLRTTEQHVFNLISEYKVNNEKMFAEKIPTLN